MAAQKVILLAYTYPPENEIGAARGHRFARYLAQFGYQAQVFSSGEFPGPVPDPPAWRCARRVEKWEMPIRKFLMPGEEGFSWVGEVERAVLDSAARENYQAIISSAPPVGAHLAAGRLSRRLGIPWIADFRDPMAGSPLRRRGLLPVSDWCVERWIVRRASRITVCTNVMHEDYRRRYPARTQDIHLLWNGFDPQTVRRTPGPKPAPGRKRLVHLGSLYDFRDPTAVLASLARLIQSGRQSADTVEVRLIGSLDPRFEQRHPDIWGYLRKIGALHTVPTHQPAAVVKQELEAASGLLLVDMNPGGVGYALPAKIFEYLPAGCPIVAMTTPGAPADWILKNAGVPTVFAYSGAGEEQVDRALLEWLAMPAERYVPNDWFWQTFDGQRQVGELASLLDGVVKPGSLH